MDKNAAVSLGGVALLAVITAVVFVATDEPDTTVPDSVFEVSSADEIPNAVRAVYRPTGDDIRCVVVPESQSNKIVVSAYCPRRTVGEWAFFPINWFPRVLKSCTANLDSGPKRRDCSHRKISR